jgi:hypothetical protein
MQKRAVSEQQQTLVAALAIPCPTGRRRPPTPPSLGCARLIPLCLMPALAAHCVEQQAIFWECGCGGCRLVSDRDHTAVNFDMSNMQSADLPASFGYTSPLLATLLEAVMLLRVHHTMINPEKCGDARWHGDLAQVWFASKQACQAGRITYWPAARVTPCVPSTWQMPMQTAHSPPDWIRCSWLSRDCRFSTAKQWR